MVSTMIVLGIDNGVKNTYYFDADGDGYGNDPIYFTCNNQIIM